MSFASAGGEEFFAGHPGSDFVGCCGEWSFCWWGWEGLVVLDGCVDGVGDELVEWGVVLLAVVDDLVFEPAGDADGYLAGLVGVGLALGLFRHGCRCLVG